MEVLTGLIVLAVLAIIVIEFLLWRRHKVKKVLPPPGDLESHISEHLRGFRTALPRPRRDPLRRTCKPLRRWAYAIPDSVTALLPLWQTANGDGVALWRRNGLREFVRVRRDGSFIVIAKTEPGLLAHTFISLIETEDWSDEAAATERASRAADALGYPYFARTVNWFLDESNRESREDHVTATEQL